MQNNNNNNNNNNNIKNIKKIKNNSAYNLMFLQILIVWC